MYNKNQKSNYEVLTPVIFISESEPFLLMGDQMVEYKEKLQLLGQELQMMNFNAILLVTSDGQLNQKIKIYNSEEYLGIHDHGYEKYFYKEFKCKGNQKLANDLYLSFKRQIDIFEIQSDEPNLSFQAWMVLENLFGQNQQLIPPIVNIQSNSEIDIQTHKQLGILLQQVRNRNYLIIVLGNLLYDQKIFYQQINVQNEKKIDPKTINKVQQLIKSVQRLTQEKPEERMEKLALYEKIPYFNELMLQPVQYFTFITAIYAANESKCTIYYHNILKNVKSLDIYIFV